MKSFVFMLLTTVMFIFSSCSKEKRSYRAGNKMKEWIKEISTYTKQKKPGFIIIPQNGAELATTELDASSDIDMDYLQHIDAITVEELFFFNTYSPDQERLALLDRLVNHKKIIVSEMVSNPQEIPTAYQLNMQHGFIPFVRGPNNYMYEYIPDTIINENNDNIETIQQVQNVLYYIGATNRFTNKNDYLESIKQTNFDLVIIDLFFGDSPLTPDDVKALRHKKNGGKRLVIAYVSIGSAERYRYYWKENWKLHHPSFIKKPYPGYPDEYYVKFWDKDWKDIIMGGENSYIDKILQTGFDGAFLDNVEVYYYLYYDE